jgi:hypothetical protein
MVEVENLNVDGLIIKSRADRLPAMCVLLCICPLTFNSQFPSGKNRTLFTKPSVLS